MSKAERKKLAKGGGAAKNAKDDDGDAFDDFDVQALVFSSNPESMMLQGMRETRRRKLVKRCAKGTFRVAHVHLLACVSRTSVFRNRFASWSEHSTLPFFAHSPA